MSPPPPRGAVGTYKSIGEGRLSFLYCLNQRSCRLYKSDLISKGKHMPWLAAFVLDNIYTVYTLYIYHARTPGKFWQSVILAKFFQYGLIGSGERERERERPTVYIVYTVTMLTQTVVVSSRPRLHFVCVFCWALQPCRMYRHTAIIGLFMHMQCPDMHMYVLDVMQHNYTVNYTVCRRVPRNWMPMTSCAIFALVSCSIKNMPASL